jgi:hypothetical protein
MVRRKDHIRADSHFHKDIPILHLIGNIIPNYNDAIVLMLLSDDFSNSVTAYDNPGS